MICPQIIPQIHTYPSRRWQREVSLNIVFIVNQPWSGERLALSVVTQHLDRAKCYGVWDICNCKWAFPKFQGLIIYIVFLLTLECSIELWLGIVINFQFPQLVQVEGCCYSYLGSTCTDQIRLCDRFVLLSTVMLDDPRQMSFYVLVYAFLRRL